MGFNKLIYIEKEGSTRRSRKCGWVERHDCSPARRRALRPAPSRDLVDKLAEHDEPVDVFCVTDADAYGTMIYQTLQEATKARGARKIKIVHLGLHPWEAVEAGFGNRGSRRRSEKRKPVADYVLKRDRDFPNEAPGGISWEEWLQTHRIELNAMTTPEFIAWLDAKMAEHRHR